MRACTGATLYQPLGALTCYTCVHNYYIHVTIPNAMVPNAMVPNAMVPNAMVDVTIPNAMVDFIVCLFTNQLAARAPCLTTNLISCQEAKISCGG